MYLPPIESTTDYEVPAPFEVVIPLSASNGTLTCTNVTIIDSDILDCLRHFQIDVVPTSLDPLVAIGSPSQAVVFIEDNDSKCYCCLPSTCSVLRSIGQC